MKEVGGKPQTLKKHHSMRKCRPVALLDPWLVGQAPVPKPFRSASRTKNSYENRSELASLRVGYEVSEPWPTCWGNGSIFFLGESSSSSEKVMPKKNWNSKHDKKVCHVIFQSFTSGSQGLWWLVVTLHLGQARKFPNKRPRPLVEKAQGPKPENPENTSEKHPQTKTAFKINTLGIYKPLANLFRWCRIFRARGLHWWNFNPLSGIHTQKRNSAQEHSIDLAAMRHGHVNRMSRRLQGLEARLHKRKVSKFQKWGFHTAQITDGYSPIFATLSWRSAGQTKETLNPVAWFANPSVLVRKALTSRMVFFVQKL